MKKGIILAVAFTILFISAHAQKHPHTLSIKKTEALALDYFNAGEYYDAIIYYNQLDSIKPDSPFYNFQMGICVFNCEAKWESLPYFQKAKSLGYTGHDIDLYLARALHLNHKMDEAIAMYRSHTPDTSLAVKDPEEMSRGEIEINDIRNHIDRYIGMCETGKEMMADSLTLIIENMGPIINSIYPDYVPVVSADATELIFTSRRPNTTGGKIDPQDNHYFEDVYISTRDSANGEWSAPKDMGPHVNSELHDACVGLSPDGHKLFIYRSEYSKKHSGDVYVSNLEGTEWTAPVKMEDHINSDDWEPSATISADEKTLFFTSNRPGGLGGTDIYVVKLQPDGHWAEPVNLGAPINTEYDEDAPYIHSDNKTLFYSSRGHTTMGGFDIFTSVYNDSTGKWAEPENAGYPINTADDDIYFVWSADGTKGYFSSWRSDSYGEKDLYVIHRPKGNASLIVFKGKVFDSETKKPLGSTITIKDNVTNEIVGIYNSNTVSGKFTLVLPHGKNYSITVEAEGYIFYSGNVNVEPNTPFFEVKKDVYLDPLKEGKSIVLNNIFFDFDKATLRKESNPELENLFAFLIKYPALKVELSGHTDSFGSDKYNEKLSQKRAEAVVAYLVSKGIDKSRMVAKGYGESKPITGNDTDEGRQLNRRTELKIIDNDFHVLNSYESTSINYKNEFTGEITQSGRSKNGNQQNTTTTTQQNTSTTTVTQQQQTSNSLYQKGEKYYIPVTLPPAATVLKPKVHFIYNVYQSLTEYSTQRLNEVVEIMNKYPAMKINIVAYADAHGNAPYNLDMATKRAKTIYDLLITKGIDASRLTTETKNIEEGNTDPNINRRVEFVVVE